MYWKILVVLAVFVITLVVMIKFNRKHKGEVNEIKGVPPCQDMKGKL